MKFSEVLVQIGKSLRGNCLGNREIRQEDFEEIAETVSNAIADCDGEPDDDWEDEDEEEEEGAFGSARPHPVDTACCQRQTTFGSTRPHPTADSLGDYARRQPAQPFGSQGSW